MFRAQLAYGKKAKTTAPPSTSAPTSAEGGEETPDERKEGGEEAPEKPASLDSVDSTPGVVAKPEREVWMPFVLSPALERGAVAAVAGICAEHLGDLVVGSP